MNDENVKLLITNLPQIITAGGALFTSIVTAIILLRQSKQKIANEQLAQGIEAKLDIVHEQVNGKMEKLLEITGASEHAKGVKEGKENPIS